MLLIILMLMTNMMSILLMESIYLWLLMEINSLFFIAFLMSMNFPQLKYITIYFIPQTITSLMLIFLIINYSIQYSMVIDMWLALSMSMKLGLFPFHFLPPMFMNYFNWNSIMIYSISQKFIPFMLIHKISSNLNHPWFNKWMLITCSLTILLSTINGMMIKNLKMIITYSSINNSCWMIPLIYVSKIYFIMFYVTYSIIMMMLIHLLNSINMNTISKSSMYMLMNNKFIFMLLCMLLFSLSMIPPFSSFMIKTISIQYLMYSNMNLTAYILAILSTLSIFMYTNIMIWMMIMLTTMPKYLISNMMFKNIKMKYLMTSIIMMTMLTFFISFYLWSK